MRREDNPTLPSLSGSQVHEFFGILDGEMGFNLSHTRLNLKASGTKVTVETAGRHLGGSGSGIFQTANTGDISTYASHGTSRESVPAKPTS